MFSDLLRFSVAVATGEIVQQLATESACKVIEEVEDFFFEDEDEDE